jgi:hypothetical protein
MIRAFTSTKGADIKVGDTIIFDNPRYDIRIERITHGHYATVGLYANDDTFCLYLAPTDTIRVLTESTL